MTEVRAYTISQLLFAYPISRSTLYREWSEGRGPKRITIGRKVLIPIEAAETWLHQLGCGAQQ